MSQRCMLYQLDIMGLFLQIEFYTCIQCLMNILSVYAILYAFSGVLLFIFVCQKLTRTMYMYWFLWIEFLSLYLFMSVRKIWLFYVRYRFRHLILNWKRYVAFLSDDIMSALARAQIIIIVASENDRYKSGSQEVQVRDICLFAKNVDS